MQFYDDFNDDQLDPSRWRYLTLPETADRVWTCHDPSVLVEVGEGTLDMHIARFERTHPTTQVLDNLKHQLISTRSFTLTDEAASFGVEMAASTIGHSPTDYREGFATFMLIDPDSGWSFRVCSTGQRVFGLYDSLRAQYRSGSPVEVIDAPISPVFLSGESHRHIIAVDPGSRSLEWIVDGRSAFRLSDVALPTSVCIGLGVATIKTLESVPPGPRQATGVSVSFGPVEVTRWSAAREGSRLISA